MLVFRRKPRAEMLAAHAAYAAKQEKLTPQRKVVTANVEAVLDLGDTVYVSFRGRAFGVPPVAWRVGQQLLALRTAALEAAGDGKLTKESSPKYFAVMEQLARVLWKHARPLGMFRRLLKRLRLLKNPFQGATEAELVELTNFFLVRRMTSAVGLPSPITRHPSMIF